MGCECVREHAGLCTAVEEADAEGVALIRIGEVGWLDVIDAVRLPRVQRDVFWGHHRVAFVKRREDSGLAISSDRIAMHK